MPYDVRALIQTAVGITIGPQTLRQVKRKSALPPEDAAISSVYQGEVDIIRERWKLTVEAMSQRVKSMAYLSEAQPWVYGALRHRQREVRDDALTLIRTQWDQVEAAQAYLNDPKADSWTKSALASVVKATNFWTLQYCLATKTMLDLSDWNCDDVWVQEHIWLLGLKGNECIHQATSRVHLVGWLRSP